MNIEYGYCHCGCGNQTTIASRNCARDGWIKGEPLRFMKGHHNRFKAGNDNPMYGKSGKDSPCWKGGRKIHKRKNTSYVLIYIPEHPRNSKGYVLEHILVVEKDWGCKLPKGSIVHHVDGNGLNNELSNLMVFKNNAEHIRFHRLHFHREVLI